MSIPGTPIATVTQLPVKRPDAREIVRKDALDFGWTHIDIGALDIYKRDNTTIHITWAPNGNSTGSGRIIDHQISDSDGSAMCIVRCRQWLRGSTDLLGSARR